MLQIGHAIRPLGLSLRAAVTAGCLLGTLFSFLPACAAPPAATSSNRTGFRQQYRLRLYDTHTHEHINVVYRKGDTYLPGAIRRLDYFLRDHRNGKVHVFDPQLFDLLYQLTKNVAHPGSEIQVVCGYRSPQTNAYLHRTTVGVATHSLHMLGEAIDIRIPGVTTAKLRAAALALHGGGVGYYPVSGFVHVDVGRARQWSLLQ